MPALKSESVLLLPVVGSMILSVFCGALHGITQREVDPDCATTVAALVLMVPLLSASVAGVLESYLKMIRWAASDTNTPRNGVLAVRGAGYLAALITIVGLLPVWIELSKGSLSIYVRVAVMPLLSVGLLFGAFAVTVLPLALLASLSTVLDKAIRGSLYVSRMAGLEADSPEILALLEVPEAIRLRAVQPAVRRGWKRAPRNVRLRTNRVKAKWLTLATFLAVGGYALELPDHLPKVSFGLSLWFFLWAVFGIDKPGPASLTRVFSEALLSCLGETEAQLTVRNDKRLGLQLGAAPKIWLDSAAKNLLRLRMTCDQLPYRARACVPEDFGSEDRTRQQIISGTEALDRAVIIQPGRNYRKTGLALPWLPPFMRSLLLALLARGASIDEDGNLEVTVDLLDEDAHVLLDELLVLFEQFGAAYDDPRIGDRVFETLEALSLEQERDALVRECSALPEDEWGGLLRSWIERGRGPSRLGAALLWTPPQFADLAAIKDDNKETLEVRGQALRAMCRQRGGLDLLLDTLQNGPWDLAQGAALALWVPLEPNSLRIKVSEALLASRPGPGCGLPFASVLLSGLADTRWPRESYGERVATKILPLFPIEEFAVHPICTVLLDGMYRATDHPGLRAAVTEELGRVTKILEARELEGRGGLSIQGETEGGELTLEQETAQEGALSSPASQGG